MNALTSKTGGPDDNDAQAGHLVAYAPTIAAPLTRGSASAPGVNPPGRRQEDDVNVVVETVIGRGLVHSLTSEGSDASEDGTGRGTPVIAFSHTAGIDQQASESVYPTVKAGHDTMPSVCVVSALHENQRGELSTSGTTGALNTGGGKPGQGYPCVVQPMAIRGRDGGAELEIGPAGAPYNALRAGDGGSSRQSLIGISDTQETTVRRLTELECERLQGYPDGWTDGQSGAARYRQLGNSVAVPVVEWIARRLIAADQMRSDT